MAADDELERKLLALQAAHATALEENAALRARARGGGADGDGEGSAREQLAALRDEFRERLQEAEAATNTARAARDEARDAADDLGDALEAANADARAARDACDALKTRVAELELDVKIARAEGGGGGGGGGGGASGTGAQAAFAALKEECESHRARAERADAAAEADRERASKFSAALRETEAREHALSRQLAALEAEAAAADTRRGAADEALRGEVRAAEERARAAEGALRQTQAEHQTDAAPGLMEAEALRMQLAQARSRAAREASEGAERQRALREKLSTALAARGAAERDLESVRFRLEDACSVAERAAAALAAARSERTAARREANEAKTAAAELLTKAARLKEERDAATDAAAAADARCQDLREQLAARPARQQEPAEPIAPAAQADQQQQQVLEATAASAGRAADAAMEAALKAQEEARDAEAAAAAARRDLEVLRARHDTALELLGEATERADDLADQMVDMKAAYRVQIESLVGAEVKGPRLWLGQGGQQLRGFMKMLKPTRSEQALQALQQQQQWRPSPAPAAGPAQDVAPEAHAVDADGDRQEAGEGARRAAEGAPAKEATPPPGAVGARDNSGEQDSEAQPQPPRSMNALLRGQLSRLWAPRAAAQT